MTTDVRDTRTLSDRVAEEVRVVLARRRMSGRELARKLEVSPNWVSLRTSGSQPIDLNDLERIAVALEVEVGDLLPRKDGLLPGSPEREPVDPLAPRVVAVAGETRKKHARRVHAQRAPVRPLTPALV